MGLDLPFDSWGNVIKLMQSVEDSVRVLVLICYTGTNQKYSHTAQKHKIEPNRAQFSYVNNKYSHLEFMLREIQKYIRTVIR